MSRPLCKTCQRPKLACICPFISPVNNSILVVVLLHPKEVNQSKGTLPLLAHSLSNRLVIEGENFSENEQLNDILVQYKHRVALLYPSETAAVLSSSSVDFSDGNKYKCLILLDATWKKAFRMYMLSTNLKSIDHIALSANIVGQYKIRKTNKKNALSTLEACCYALGVLESSPEKYVNLLQNFVDFNQFQLSFRK